MDVLTDQARMLGEDEAYRSLADSLARAHAFAVAERQRRQQERLGALCRPVIRAMLAEAYSCADAPTTPIWYAMYPEAPKRGYVRLGHWLRTGRLL